MRSDKKRVDSSSSSPHKMYLGSDEFITTLHPDGSFNNLKFVENKRELIRPEINYPKAIVNILLPIIGCVVIFHFNSNVAILLICLIFLLKLRSIVIWFIRVYQRYAAEEVRLACLFEPSCSEYMILSIKKYGVLLGCIKGIKRLRRCHFPNGGEDYP